MERFCFAAIFYFSAKGNSIVVAQVKWNKPVDHQLAGLFIQFEILATNADMVDFAYFGDAGGIDLKASLGLGGANKAFISGFHVADSYNVIA